MYVLVTAFIHERTKQGFLRQRNSTLIPTTVSTAVRAFRRAQYRLSSLSRTFPTGGRNSQQSTLSGTPRRQRDAPSLDQRREARGSLESFYSEGQRSHDLFEHLAAVLVVFKLIEAGAGGSEQYNVAGLRDRVGFADRIF
jgi:hypothetical protein